MTAAGDLENESRPACPPRSATATEFYLIHYEGNMAVVDAMRGELMPAAIWDSAITDIKGYLSKMLHCRETYVLLCLLAYYVEWHMRRALAPLLFTDEHPQEQASPVASARRSAAAQAKARTKRTAHGLAVQSFHDLLKDLATIVKTVSGLCSSRSLPSISLPAPRHYRNTPFNFSASDCEHSA